MVAEVECSRRLPRPRHTQVVEQLLGRATEVEGVRPSVPPHATTIICTGPPTRVHGVEHDHLVAGSPQQLGCRQAGQAATDDDDISSFMRSHTIPTSGTRRT